MGESVSEATIISWSKNIGDMIALDETIIEIATDKVDSEVPSTHEGKLIEMLFAADDVVQVGEPFAILETKEEGAISIVNEAAPEPVAAKAIEKTAVEPSKITFVGDDFHRDVARPREFGMNARHYCRFGERPGVSKSPEAMPIKHWDSFRPELGL